MSRIQFTRDDLLNDFVEVQSPPEVLTEKFARAPFCHLLSTYVIRPVACDQLPFFIHHKNKQPIFMQEKKQIRRETGVKQVEGFSSSDDEFEKVKTDNKREANAAKKSSAVSSEQAFNPAFPASDPTKVKVVAPLASGKKAGGEAPPKKMGLDLGKVASEGDGKIVRPSTQRKVTGQETAEEAKAAIITRPATAKKAKAAPKKEPEANNYFAAAMQQNSGAAPVKAEAAPANPPQSTGKKNKNKKAQQEAPVEEKKVAAPEPKIEEKPQKQQAPKKAAKPAQAPAGNDFMAQMAAGAQKTQEQESTKKANKAAKRQGKNVKEEFVTTKFGQGEKKSGFAGLYD